MSRENEPGGLPQRAGIGIEPGGLTQVPWQDGLDIEPNG